jgi:hypothetical protein
MSPRGTGQSHIGEFHNTFLEVFCIGDGIHWENGVEDWRLSHVLKEQLYSGYMINIGKVIGTLED